jgi:hypothetical protein
VNHIDKGNYPRRSSLEAVEATFEAAWIEFFGDTGVSLRRAVR